ncbi:MAG: ROK family protein [Candidatus Omnitrophica bacterium]|nr:ROK family protein [Candidatus Omnitrophota bacterium]
MKVWKKLSILVTAIVWGGGMYQAQALSPSAASPAEESVPAFNVAISMGGTKVAVSVVDEQGNVLFNDEAHYQDVYGKPGRDLTVDQVTDLVAGQILKGVDHIPGGGGPGGIGIAFPGIVDSPNGIVKFANNLPIKEPYPFIEAIRGKISRRTGRQVKMGIINDASAAVIGELSPKGTLAGKRSGIAVILGTGVNAAAAKERHPYYGGKGEINEIGFNVFGDGTEYGRVGYRFIGFEMKGAIRMPEEGETNFEFMCSGPNLTKKLFGPHGFDVQNVTEAARQGNAKARELIETAGREVGSALAALIEPFVHEEFVKNIVLVSGVSEHLGLGLVNDLGEDLFIAAIRRQARAELAERGIDSRTAAEITSGIVRSRMGYEREFTAFTPGHEGVHYAHNGDSKEETGDSL